MKESYTSSVAVHADTVWTKHGSVSSMNRLDGYAVGEQPDLGKIGKVASAPEGTLWIWAGHQISRFRNSRWDSFDVENVTQWGTIRSDPEQYWYITSNRLPSLRGRIWVLGVNANEALILLPDQILEFDARGKTAKVILSSSQTGLGHFISMRWGSRHQVWVTGSQGLGQLSLPNPGWVECLKPPVEYLNFEEPFEGENGEVFVAATEGSPEPAVLRFDGSQWEIVYRGESRNLRGWRGEERTLWIQDGNRLLHLTRAGKQISVERRGPLSGVVLSIEPGRENRFWVGTTHGLATYAPPLWRKPPEVADLDDVVSSITEDAQGRLWFLSTHSLIGLHGDRWVFYPLPKGETAWPFTPEGIVPLPDGTLAVRTDSTDLLIFDPEGRRFRTVKHPAGRDIRLFFQQPDGCLLVQTVPRGSSASFSLEIFDGQSFHEVLNPGPSWNITDLRTLVTGSAGELWAGGSDRLGVYRNGSFSRMGAQEGFTDSGAFFLKQVRGGRLLAGGRDSLFEYDGRAWHCILHGLDRVRNITMGRDGSVWIASGTGVHRLKDGTWISHGTHEGLPSDIAYRVFEDSRGRVWSGTTRGLSLLHPEADRDPPVTKISAEQNAREIAPGGRVRLVFSGVDKWNLTPPERLLFSWRMDGGQWSAFAGGNGASFDQLNSGDHQFAVRAMDRNGNIDPHPALYSFSVLPPWYRTRVVRYLGGASVLIIGVLLAVAISSLRALSRRKCLENDRQEILEMVARREPLPDILQRLVRAIAENHRGAIGAAVQYDGGVLQYLPVSSLTLQLRNVIERWRGAEACVQHDLAYLGLKHGANVPITSGANEGLGAAIALFPDDRRRAEKDTAVFETFNGIAAAAIESAGLYEQLRHQAQHDMLTGLPNRMLVEAELQAALRQAQETGQSATVMFLDLDRFKQINDSLGHRAGDSVLAQVAARLIQAVPDGAMAARVGGDEFTIIWRRPTGKAAVERAAARIMEALRAPLLVEGNEYYPSVSMGISLFPSDGQDAATLQKNADLALYRAKALGKDRYEFFSEDIDKAGAQAMAMEQVLRRALDEQWFEMFYQAQFGAAGDLDGMEALVRLHHPQLGLIPPGEFIALTEETGLIHRLGEWVLEEVCRQIRAWQLAGYKPVKVAVNVSLLQFREPGFAETVRRTLDKMQIDPRLIELELTESMIMGDPEDCARQMHKLRTLGVSIAVDDFGTGFSSLARLHRLPIDVLKIDQSFIQEIDSTSSSRPLVQAIIALAHNLNLTVVAEGVETECQRKALDEVACDFLQGYLLHKPQSAANIEQNLLKRSESVRTYSELRSHVPQ